MRLRWSLIPPRPRPRIPAIPPDSVSASDCAPFALILPFGALVLSEIEASEGVLR